MTGWRQAASECTGNLARAHRGFQLSRRRKEEEGIWPGLWKKSGWNDVAIEADHSGSGPITGAAARVNYCEPRKVSAWLSMGGIGWLLSVMTREGDRSAGWRR